MVSHQILELELFDFQFFYDFNFLKRIFSDVLIRKVKTFKFEYFLTSIIYWSENIEFQCLLLIRNLYKKM